MPDWRRLILSLCLCWAVPGMAQPLEARADMLLVTLAREAPELRKLIDTARAVLVFPEVVAMTFGSGGQYGEGVLLVDGQVVARYATTGVEQPVLPPRVAHRTDVLLFMSDAALWGFRNRSVWRPGVDGQVRLPRRDLAGRWAADRESAEVLGFSLAGPDLDEPLQLVSNTLSRIR